MYKTFTTYSKIFLPTDCYQKAINDKICNFFHPHQSFLDVVSSQKHFSTS